MASMGPGGQRPQLVRLRDGLPWREIEGAIVVLDLESSSYFAVNRAGTALWPRLQEGATVDELTDALAAAEDIDPERARADVAAFVGDLRRRELLAP